MDRGGGTPLLAEWEEDEGEMAQVHMGHGVTGSQNPSFPLTTLVSLVQGAKWLVCIDLAFESLSRLSSQVTGRSGEQEARVRVVKLWIC